MDGEPTIPETPVQDPENSIPWDGGGIASEKKKRRRKTTQDDNFVSLPEHALIEKDEQAVAELQAAYRILQALKQVKNIGPFYDEPSTDKYGMSSYFQIIKKPMWLNEIWRKLECGEYDGLHDFVDDVHLILYNCYKFWGHMHRISYRGYVIEHKLEKKLSELPTSLKEKVTCTKENGECVICNTTEDRIEDEELEETVDDPDKVYYNSKGYRSKIVVKVLNEEEQEVELGEETAEEKEERLKMEKWERETLNKIDGASDIAHIAELVDIGLFLKLAHEVLNVEEMTQYEVERMLLMPLESSTLQTLMTSVLSPEWRRNTLDETPLMPYRVWNATLRHRLNYWFNTFYKNADPIETFEKIGVDPYFWSVVHLVNPLGEDTLFHELPFYTRVWIFKSLLDNLLHTNKTIIDVFAEEKCDPDNLRHSYFGRGVKNHHYKALPQFLPEIRVYREMSALMSIWTEVWPEPEHGIMRLQRNRMTYNEEALLFGPNLKTFELVAWDLDSLNVLMKYAIDTELEDLTQFLTDFKERVESSHIRCEGLKSVYKQFNDYQSRTVEYFTNLENLWLSYTKPVTKQVKQEKTEDTVLGKRRKTPSRLMIEDFTNSSSDSHITERSESEISDWESSYKNKGQRKKKLKRTKKELKLTELPVSPPKDDKTVKNESVFMMDFKMEPSETPEVSTTTPHIGEEFGVSSLKIESVCKFEESASSIVSSSEPKEEVVVLLSSDEEEDVKPQINKIKLRNLSSLLEAPPVQPAPPPQPVPQSQPVPSLLPNNLNVVIPINAISPLNQPVNPRMSVQVPPNLYQPRQRAPMNRPSIQQMMNQQMMMRGGRAPMRGNGQLRPLAPMRMASPQQRPVRPVTVPRPITPKKPVPKPLMMSPQEWAKTSSPTSTPPGTPPSRGPSPRGRSPATPPQRWGTGSPKGAASQNQVGGARAGLAPKSLFTEPPEGKLTMGRNESGTGYGYQIVLPDGGIRYLTDAEVVAIKRRNSGTLPRTIRMPPDGSFL